MSFLEIFAEIDTWVNKHFFSVLEHKTMSAFNLCPVFSLKLMFTNWKQYPTKEYFINVCESGHGSKDPPILSRPQKVLWNFKSVFIIDVTHDCLEAELELRVTASWIQIASD